jgi:hypothetical protein
MPPRFEHGLSSPVLTSGEPDWLIDYAGVTAEQLLALSDEQLAGLDPLAVNLIVAKGIPQLADLDISHYQSQLNAWAWEFANQYLPAWTNVFEKEPEYYAHNPRLFEVGMIQQFFAHDVGICYRHDTRDAVRIRVLNPSDSFLNGLLDTLEGTCASMPVLYVALAWRMGWPVSLACQGGHFLTRYDDGSQVFNIEAALPRTMRTGFHWATDELQIKLRNIPAKALSSGSDLKALTPRERLGVFFAMRARHYRDMASQYGDYDWLRRAERDYLLACHLFPAYREANNSLTFVRAVLAAERFDPDEAGHPASFAHLLWEVQQYERGTHLVQEPMPPPRRPGDSVFIRPQLSDPALAAPAAT